MDIYAFSFQQLITSFRVSELQVLLGFAGRNKSGRKQELLQRALQLVERGCSTPIQIKIRELYRCSNILAFFFNRKYFLPLNKHSCFKLIISLLRWAAYSTCFAAAVIIFKMATNLRTRSDCLCFIVNCSNHIDKIIFKIFHYYFIND